MNNMKYKILVSVAVLLMAMVMTGCVTEEEQPIKELYSQDMCYVDGEPIESLSLDKEKIVINQNTLLYNSDIEVWIYTISDNLQERFAEDPDNFQSVFAGATPYVFFLHKDKAEEILDLNVKFYFIDSDNSYYHLGELSSEDVIMTYTQHTNIIEYDLIIDESVPRYLKIMTNLSREEWVNQQLEMYGAGEEIRLLKRVGDDLSTDVIIVNDKTYWFNDYHLTIIPDETENRIVTISTSEVEIKDESILIGDKNIGVKQVDKVHLFVDRSTASRIGGEQCQRDADCTLCFSGTKKYNLVFSPEPCVTYTNELFETDFK